MRRRIPLCVRTVALLLLALAWMAAPAAAQTTVVLDAPDSEVVDTTIRAGSYANTNLERGPLETRASTNWEYLRRALLKFDTHTTIPERATIRSATLTVTIEYANPETRTLTAYRVGSSWDEHSATWNSRSSGSRWGTSGGDLAGQYGAATASTSVGAKINFDVTRLVQEVVNGNYGSRYTRVALVDNGGSTSNSYRQFYTSEASDASVRPRLTVVYGGSSTSTTSTTSTSTSTSTSSSGTTFKMLQWNTHHGGIGTDGVYNPGRIASWIAKMAPDVVSLNEVDTDDQVNAIVSALQSKTGVTWRKSFSGHGNLMLTRLSMNSSSRCLYASTGAYAAHLSVTINGRALNVWSTHLSAYSASDRLSEAKAMQACAANWPEARILAGDYNMQQGSTEYNQAVTGYSDAWLAAKAIGATTNYSGNCDGCTRNSRIDYVFASKGASFLSVKAAAIIDTRDANGYMPSDHKPTLVTYTVK
jgi:endonuclease/exonuclease/phosphatase family metal-dependent hydrolase